MQKNAPLIAVTFDDGPHETQTVQILNAAAQRGIRLTFFVVGSRIARAREVLVREVKEGHEIGNHSWSHTSFANLSETEIGIEIAKTDAAIFDASGFESKLFRPPYGILSKSQRRFVETSSRHKVVLWNIDPQDWKRPALSDLENYVISHVKPGSILLLHDIIPGTAEASARIFDSLSHLGYRFVTVSELRQQSFA